jgi:hypothetical protein
MTKGSEHASQEYSYTLLSIKTVSLDISYSYQLSFPVLDNLFLILSLIHAVLDNKDLTFFIMPGTYSIHATSSNIFLL